MISAPTTAGCAASGRVVFVVLATFDDMFIMVVVIGGGTSERVRVPVGIDADFDAVGASDRDSVERVTGGVAVGVSRVALTVGDPDTDCDTDERVTWGDAVRESLGIADTDIDFDEAAADTDRESVTEAVADREGLAVALGRIEADGVLLAVGDGECESLADAEPVTLRVSLDVTLPDSDDRVTRGESDEVPLSDVVLLSDSDERVTRSDSDGVMLVDADIDGVSDDDMLSESDERVTRGVSDDDKLSVSVADSDERVARCESDDVMLVDADIDAVSENVTLADSEERVTR